MKKFITIFFGLLFALFASTFATEYIFFYGDGNFDSEEVEEFFIKEEIENDYIIKRQDIYFNDDAWEYFMKKVQDYNIPSDKWEMPILIVEGDDGYGRVYAGKTQVKNFFKYPESNTYIIKEEIVTTKVGDYTRVSSKKKRTAQLVVKKIEELFQEKSKGNIYSKIKLYESTFNYLENLMKKKDSLEIRMLIYYVKINMVIEYLQLINKA